METLSLNLKKFRLSKKLTQEQAAEALHVSTQTISCWETGVTLPDVLKLPEIARLYCITIEDLFRDNSTAYENYAQRLASVYEANQTSQNFIAAEQEFSQLIDRGSYSMDDLRTFGIVYQFMMMDCRDKALAWFDRGIRESVEIDPDMCRRTKEQRLRLLSLIGQSAEGLRQQKEQLACHPDQEDSWILMVVAELHCNDNYAALDYAQQGLERFPESWELNIHASDSSRHLGHYQAAMDYADRALALRPDLADGKFSKAWCYEAQGDHQAAAQIHLEIAKDFQREGFEIEAQTQRNIAAQLLEQHSVKSAT